MQPLDPLVGSTVLRRPAIQSPNYQHGVSGWTINSDGSAEFNNLQIRGTFNGNDFILDSTGFFLYDGAPAANHLIYSVTPTTTSTDPEGNAIASDGATSYANAGAFWIALGMGSGILSWFHAASEAGPWIASSSIGFTFDNIAGGGIEFTAENGFSGALEIPQSTPGDWPLSHTGNDNNSGTTFVSGERAQMNNLWSVPINLLIDTVNSLISQLQAAGILGL